MKRQAYSLPEGTFAFENALKKPGLSFICECKKASPSKGVIAEEFPYLQIAKEYEAAGADCISVLTEPKWRGRGVASAMIDEALMQLSSQHVAYLCARSVRRNKSAIQMFKRSGFDWVRTECYLLGRDI